MPRVSTKKPAAKKTAKAAAVAARPLKRPPPPRRPPVAPLNRPRPVKTHRPSPMRNGANPRPSRLRPSPTMRPRPQRNPRARGPCHHRQGTAPVSVPENEPCRGRRSSDSPVSAPARSSRRCGERTVDSVKASAQAFAQRRQPVIPGRHTGRIAPPSARWNRRKKTRASPNAGYQRDKIATS